MRQETGRVASYPLCHWELIMDPFKVLFSETQRRHPPPPILLPVYSRHFQGLHATFDLLSGPSVTFHPTKANPCLWLGT